MCYLFIILFLEYLANEILTKNKLTKQINIDDWTQAKLPEL